MIQTMGLVWGVPVLQAANCKEALKLIKSERGRIKLILLDYFMPGMEPAKCVASISAAAGSSTEIVLMTAAANPAVRAAELKMKHWLSKPFELSSLQALLTA
jgi:CheY-like chemotaxis protein